jgi:pimeloyl-ACP methyl ester carboxylesterase
MNRQSQWLFETPSVSELASNSNLKYYSNTEWQTEWELQESNPTGRGTTIPVIIVPGIMGTRLETPNGRMVWNPRPRIKGSCSIGFGEFAANYNRLNSSALIPREQHNIPQGSLGGIVGCPNEFAQANAIPHFGNLIFNSYYRLAFDLNNKVWQAGMLAGQSIKVYACGYDWRQDNADSARRLDDVVKQALAETGAEQVILVAHSMGGLVSRYYCKMGGASKVMGLILLGSPTHGAPQTYRMLKEGISLFMDFKLGGIVFPERTRFQLMQMMRRFPSAYQLLPSRHYCLSQPDWLQFAPGKTPLPDASKAVALYSDPYVGFLDGLNGGPKLDLSVKNALARRQRFDEALFDPSAGCYMPRNTFLIFSKDIDTEAKYRLEKRGSLGSKVLSPFNVVPLSNAPGDATVPEFSATAASCVATRLILQKKVKHGDLPNDPNVIKAIKTIIQNLLIARMPTQIARTLTTRSTSPFAVPIRR